jgi:tRNA A-37 threonylcarbamoyl transferase component Bud32
LDVVASIPTYVERLESLSTVHDKNAEVTLKVKDLQVMQDKILTSFSTNHSLLNSIKEGFEENMTIIKGNLEQIEKRAENLK